VLIAAAAAGQTPAFTDVTSDAGVVAVHDPSPQFVLSQFDLSPMTAGGLAGDFDNDGWQDLYVIISGTLPDQLFINNGDGTFTDEAAAWGVDYAHMGLGGAVGDYNGDGWLDIFLTSIGPATDGPDIGHHVLYRNNGNGTFTDVAADMGVQTISTESPDGFGAAFGDYDLDGDLDLAVVGWIPTGDQNKLFRNDGDTFTDVTASAGFGLDDMDDIRGFSPAFADMNGDRYPELLIAADFGTSHYFINDGDGTFTEYTAESGTGLDGNGMGHFIADLNGDGLFDWYVTSIYSPDSGLLGVPGTGNMLYMNQGNHVFQEQSIPVGVNDGGWGWGTVPVDIEHDGKLDIVETNGWAQWNHGEPEWQNEQTYVWSQQDGFVFQDVAALCGITHDGYGRGMLNFDYDNDGDQDLVIFSLNDSLVLYRNDLDLDAGNTSWLRVFLDTSATPGLAPNGFGSTVVATVDGVSQHRMIVGGAHYLSHSELSAHFGLGSADTIDELRVEWNNGAVTVLQDVAVDRTIVIESPTNADINGDGSVNVQDLILVLTGWGGDDPAVDLNGDGTVDVLDLVIVVTNWG
jgi:hypothetical protein